MIIVKLKDGYGYYARASFGFGYGVSHYEAISNLLKNFYD